MNTETFIAIGLLLPWTLIFVGVWHMIGKWRSRDVDMRAPTVGADINALPTRQLRRMRSREHGRKLAAVSLPAAMPRAVRRRFAAHFAYEFRREAAAQA